MHVVSYNSLHGTVRVHLPDDVAQGDTISGTIAIEPAGRTEAEKTANTGVLRGTVIDAGGQKTTAASPVFTLRVAEALTAALPIAFSAPSGWSRQRATASVPLASTEAVEHALGQIAKTPGGFRWPPTVTQGSPATITGAFDGDLANTRVTIGSTGAAVLAESRRKLVVQMPTGGMPGPSTLTLQERDTRVSGPVRTLGVQLSAPKTDLQRGESTDVTVEIAGLQGLDHPVPVQLRTSGTVTTAGGNRQEFDIPPGDPGVAANGVFRTSRRLTGVAAGGFEFVAEVVWANPAGHWLVGRTVHVEGEPGGNPGRWRVPIILAGSKTKRGIYFGGEKPPDLHYCNWIEVKGADGRDGVDYVTEFERTTDPSKPPPMKPLPPVPPAGTKPLPPGPAMTGGGTTTTSDPPPCKEGETKVLSTVEKTFTLLDGKQELFMHVYTDKDAAAVAAGEFAAYLKKIAEVGDKVTEVLPEGDGAGGTVVGFLLKYLEEGGGIIDTVLKKRVSLAGASTFTATMDAGLRDIVAQCTTLETCVRGVRVVEKKFTQKETKRREMFTKKAVRGDDEWEKITDSTTKIDPEKAAKWAQDFFTETANVLKTNGEELKKFKDACK